MQELSEQADLTGSKMEAMQKQIQEMEAGLTVALKALQFDKANAARCVPVCRCVMYVSVRCVCVRVCMRVLRAIVEDTTLN